MQKLKKITFGLFILFMMGSFNTIKTAATEELKWYDWNEGVIKARKEGKIALIDTYTDWCHWCKVMDKNTYTNELVIAAINKDFVPIKFNPELDRRYINGGDTLSGRELLGALSGGNSSGYPTTYFYLTKKVFFFKKQDILNLSNLKQFLKEWLQNTISSFYSKHFLLIH